MNKIDVQIFFFLMIFFHISRKFYGLFNDQTFLNLKFDSGKELRLSHSKFRGGFNSAQFESIA